METVRVGDSGDAVKRAQEAITKYGFGPLVADGDFGPLTGDAVRRFQHARGLDADGVVGPATWEALSVPLVAEQHVGAYTPAAVLAVCRNKDYAVRDDGQMNIVGVRSDTRSANEFDDVMYFIWMSGGEWRHHVYRATTDPGTFWLEHPMRSEGTAIVCEGHYPASYKFGMHRGVYETLCQRSRIRVYRDSNRDATLDTDESTVIEGYFGCNIHKAGRDSTSVNRWSAGCQVFARESDWSAAMALCKGTGAERFDYTLLLESDFSPVIG